MIQRNIIETIKQMADKMPVISITEPRQSGKTTVAKMCFPDYDLTTRIYHAFQNDTVKSTPI